MGTFNQSKYINDYIKDTYDTIKVQVKKGERDIIKIRAKEKDFSSVNAYINNLIKNDMEGKSDMTLTPEEQMVLNMMRYTTDADRDEIVRKAQEINGRYSDKEKRDMYNLKLLQVKNNNGIINM